MEHGFPNAETLDIRDFSLYGFETCMEELERRLQGAHIRHGEPAAAEVSNAIFVPVSRTSLNRHEGALLAGSGGPIPQALSTRRVVGWSNDTLGILTNNSEVEPVSTVDETVVYLGWYFDHFGHFLLESLARSWILQTIDPSMKVVFHTLQPPIPGSAGLQILEMLDVPHSRILPLDSPTLLKRVIVPEPLYELSHFAHERMPHPFLSVAEKVVQGENRSEQPVYFSRRLLPAAARTIVGEFELEEILRENGFLVVHPETLTLREQISLVNRYRTFLTSNGSAAYLTLFSLEPPVLNLLTESIPVHLDFFLIPKVSGIDTSYANCLAGGHRPSNIDLVTPYMVQLDKAVGFLDSLGLLKSRLRSSVVASSRRLNAEYDELWIYAYVRHLPRGENLGDEMESRILEEALGRATRSWPLSWILAQHFLGRDPSQVDEQARQFSALVAHEDDVGRLVHFHHDVALRARRVLRACSPETAAMLAKVLVERFQIDLTDRLSRIERRRLRAGISSNHE